MQNPFEVSDEDIQTLCAEALAVGDDDLVSTCRKALRGVAWAKYQVSRIIRDERLRAENL
jgi:hypothetical protein